MIRWVNAARLYPARCAVLPQVGGNHPLGYFDTGVDTVSGERVYVSVLAAQAFADAIGYRRPGDVEKNPKRVAELEAEIAEFKERLDEADKFAEAAEYTLSRFGAKVQRKPGRKPGEKVTA